MKIDFRLIELNSRKRISGIEYAGIECRNMNFKKDAGIEFQKMCRNRISGIEFQEKNFKNMQE